MRLAPALALLMMFALCGTAAAESLTWVCPDCPAGGAVYSFDPQDVGHMNWWKTNHRAVVHGRGSVGVRPTGRPSLPGFVFLGGLGGGLLGAALSGSITGDGDIVRAAGAGAFAGGVFMGLLWVVSATNNTATASAPSVDLDDDIWDRTTNPVASSTGDAFSLAMRMTW